MKNDQMKNDQMKNDKKASKKNVRAKKDNMKHDDNMKQNYTLGRPANLGIASACWTQIDGVSRRSRKRGYL